MIDIALLGFGTVGGGVADIILKNNADIKVRTGLDINIKYILDLREFPGHPLENRVVKDYNIILNDPSVTIVAEMLGGTHPAYDFTKAALEAGKSVVTSNKAVVAEFGPELLQIARDHKVRYLFEASVGGGIPIIRPMTESLTSTDIYEIDGILNGTTNYILTRMKDAGISYEEALKEAQKLGYAEADPTADVDGFDACRKICILAAVAFGKLVPFEMVKTTGIRNVTIDDIKKAEKENSAIKLIARAVKTGDKLYISVEPTAVKSDSPLYNVNDVFNGILVRGKISGDLMFYGKGAGKLPTASAVLSDIIDIAHFGDRQPLQSLWQLAPEIYTSELN